jgi:conjugative relaxase-like TrwC/TraI family protein
MFTMAKITDGSTYLGNHLVQNDYYNEDEKVLGHWLGSLAADLGLDSPISSGDVPFENLRQNLLPDGSEKLTQRTNTERKCTEKDALKALRQSERYRGGGKPSPEDVAAWLSKHPTTSNRIAFYDFQCSAQKSVSIMGITFGDQRLLDAHEEISQRAFEEMEKFAARRIGKEQSVITGNLVAAKFTHTSSRSLDAQLHSHFVTANCTRDPVTGQIYGLESAQMIKAIRYAGKFYQNEMARAVQRLGYPIDLVRDSKGNVTGWEIAGITEEMREKQSSRSSSIEKAAQEFERHHGRAPTAAERRVLSLETRSEKMLDSSEADNLATQRQKYTPEEIQKIEAVKALALARALSAPPSPSPGLEREAIAYARDHLFERNSVAPAHEVLAEALNWGLGKLDPQKLSEALREDWDLVSLVGEGATATLTTGTNLLLESEAVENCRSRQGKETPFSKKKAAADLSAWTRKNKGFELSEEQQAAVSHVLESKDGIFAIRGVAGAGKTTMLQEVNAQLEERGASMIFLSPPSTMVDELRKEGFENAMTVAKYLVEARKHPEQFRGKMIFVDEAGLQGVMTGHEVQMTAARLGQRLCFVGDTRQHSSVEAGDYLRVLEDHAHLDSAILSKISRQKPSEYRSAISAFASGDFVQGWEKLEKFGAIKEGQASYLQEAASAFLDKAEGGKALDKVLCVAPTHAELDTLNSSIREGLKKSGHLKGEEILIDSFRSSNLTAAEKREPGRYSPGSVLIFQGSEKHKTVSSVDSDRRKIFFEGGGSMDLKRAGVSKFSVGSMNKIGIIEGEKILIRANEKQSGLVNGKILTVSGFDKDGGILTREGQKIPKGFADLKHGYAVTSHASQGKTVDHVVVAAQRMDSKALYVSTSRGRKSVSLHVPEKESMEKTLKEDTRKSALDVKEARARRYDKLTLRRKPRNLEEIAARRRKTAEKDLDLLPSHQTRDREKMQHRGMSM